MAAIRLQKAKRALNSVMRQHCTAVDVKESNRLIVEFKISNILTYSES